MAVVSKGLASPKALWWVALAALGLVGCLHRSDEVPRPSPAAACTGLGEPGRTEEFYTQQYMQGESLSVMPGLRHSDTRNQWEVWFHAQDSDESQRYWRACVFDDDGKALNCDRSVRELGDSPSVVVDGDTLLTWTYGYGTTLGEVAARAAPTSGAMLPTLTGSGLSSRSHHGALGLAWSESDGVHWWRDGQEGVPLSWSRGGGFRWPALAWSAADADPVALAIPDDGTSPLVGWSGLTEEPGEPIDWEIRPDDFDLVVVDEGRWIVVTISSGSMQVWAGRGLHDGAFELEEVGEARPAAGDLRPQIVPVAGGYAVAWTSAESPLTTWIVLLDPDGNALAEPLTIERQGARRDAVLAARSDGRALGLAWVGQEASVGHLYFRTVPCMP